MKATRMHEFRAADLVLGRLRPLILAPLAGHADEAKSTVNQSPRGTSKKPVQLDGALDKAAAQNPDGPGPAGRSAGARPFASRTPITSFLLPVLLAAASSAFAQSAPAAGVQLYTCDCGLTEFKNADAFSDTGEYEGKSLALPAPAT